MIGDTELIKNLYRLCSLLLLAMNGAGGGWADYGADVGDFILHGEQFGGGEPPTKTLPYVLDKEAIYDHITTLMAYAAKADDVENNYNLDISECIAKTVEMNGASLWLYHINDGADAFYYGLSFRGMGGGVPSRRFDCGAMPLTDEDYANFKDNLMRRLERLEEFLRGAGFLAGDVLGD